MASSKYYSLNGLRALSILFVIINHYHFPKTSILGRMFFTDGQLGVNVFFVISGFLITSLLIKEQEKTGTISFKNFYIRRTLRIFPAYYFLLLVYFILTLLGIIEISAKSWFTSITYTKYFNWGLDWYTDHAWSLSIEEHFYLMWPLMFSIGPRFRKYFLYSIIVICPLLRVYGATHTSQIINGLTIFERLDTISIGCLFALYQEKVYEFFKSHRKIIFTVGIVWLLTYRFIREANTEYGLHLGWFLIPFGNSIGSLTSFIIGFIMIYSVFETGNIWFKFLNTRIMEQIGVLSYSIYLWQQFFTSELPIGRPIFPLNLLFIAGASLFSYYVIEKPFLRLKDRFAVK